MANCNNTVEFIDEKERMCKSLKKSNDGVCSAKCPLRYRCHSISSDNVKKAIEIVQKWSDENPVKTIMMDLLEKYPNVRMDILTDSPDLCPHHLVYEDYRDCDNDCKRCWNRPLEMLETIDKTK